jgi:hypothetical protein
MSVIIDAVTIARNEDVEMKMRWSVSVLMIAIMCASVASSRANAQTFGGSATGIQVTVPATGTVIRAATGTVPITGGGTDASVLVGDIPGSATGGVVSVSAGTVHSAIIGIDATRAEASMANLAVTVSGNQISADFLLARAATSCGPTASGSSEFRNLVINGQTITVSGAPNQTITLPNGTAVLNEQSSSVGGTNAAATVYGLHVMTTDSITHQQVADVVLASAAPQINCQGGSQPDSGYGTGGGWIDGAAPGNRANFGVVGGRQPNGTFKGHVTFADHTLSPPFKIQSTEITNVSETALCETTITGLADVNGTPGVEFVVRIKDNGEPGKDNDEFQIQAGTYTNADTILNGGNIQHHPNCR